VKRANTLGKRDYQRKLVQRQVNQRFPKEALTYSIENSPASLALPTMLAFNQAD
jgi:hypothetical protein